MANYDNRNNYNPYEEQYEYANQAPRKQNKQKKVRKTALIIILILAVLIAAAFILIEVFTEAPDVKDEGLHGDDINIEEGVTNGRYNGMYTFLVVGRDKVGNNTDTIMVGRLDVVHKTLHVINIPRDTLVNINFNKKNINYIYPACVNTGEDAIGALSEAVSDMLGFNIDNYIVVDLQAAEELVDCIGGVEFDVPLDMKYDDPAQDLHIDINAGLQTLDGANAVKVFRYREGYANADIGRISVQQDLLKAIARQMLTLGNIPNIGEIIDIVENHTETDLTGDNIRFYAKAFLTMKDENIKFMTLPYVNCGMIFNWSSLFADIDAWIDMVNEYINPYVDKVKVENVNMLTYMDGNFYYTSEPMRGSISGMLGYTPGTSVDGAGILQYVSKNTDN